MKKFFTYKIFSQPFNSELLSGIMWQFDINGLLEEDDHISVFTSDISTDTEIQFTKALDQLQNDKLIDSYKIEKEILEDQNWNKLWEKSREVIRITDRVVIKPTFKEYKAKPNEIVLTIDPKMSFGTGEHQTTKLMLKQLEQIVKPGMKVLDVGSGTGILSIAAIKFGVANAVAIDSDEICFENCKENCIQNDVENSIEVMTGEIENVQERDFDLILANIQKNILLDIAEKIRQRLKKDGIVILSGLLVSDQKEIEKKYHLLGFKTVQFEQMDEWIAIVLSRSEK
jgi:ribosomal protein L11 methyltransferase